MTARSRGRKDGSQDEIFGKCNDFGMVVIPQSQYRGHWCDGFIGHKGIWIPAEIKQSIKSKLTDREKLFWSKCLAKDLPLIHAISFDDVLSAFE